MHVGITETPQDNERDLIVRVELTASGILQTPGVRQLSYTRDVSFEPIKPATIEVSTKLGIFEVGEKYDYCSSEEYGNEITYSVQRATISGRIYANVVRRRFLTY